MVQERIKRENSETMSKKHSWRILMQRGKKRRNED